MANMVPSRDCNSRWKHTAFILLSYLLFGALHEASHVLTAAYMMGGRTSSMFHSTTSWPQLLLQVLLGRQVDLSGVLMTVENDERPAFVVRHAGWITSCFMAILVHAFVLYASKQANSSKQYQTTLVLAAYATALEAMVSDLFQMGHFGTSKTIFYCGNFGLILLNPAWFTDSHERGNCHSAVDILQQMIRVTMMRGAQSGGVVTFEPKYASAITAPSGMHQPPMTAIRSRVVNRKRTDLSEGIVKKVSRDNQWSFRKCASKGQQVKTFSGHTRFATSSIANFDGTHPHRWSPLTQIKVYDFGTAKANTVGVENYIMHNGDFEFYEVNGTTYDLETVQDFLLDVLLHPMPSTGDSCAIAGMVDLMRTKGSFGLSVRYALALGMPGRTMKANSTLGLPNSFAVYQNIGAVFEDALQRHLQKYTASNMTPVQVLAATSNDPHLRDDLAKTVGPLLRNKYKELIQPLVPFHLSAPRPDHDDDFDEESGNKDAKDKSLACFAKTTIDAFFDNDLFQTTKVFLSNAHGSFGLCITSTLDAANQMCLAARGQTMSVGFYPKAGLVLYGSEQAAVKAALDVATPGGDLEPISRDKEVDDSLNRCAARLDLDDLGGEICLLDWSKHATGAGGIMSHPNRHLQVHQIMNDTIKIVLYQQHNSHRHRGKSLFHRMTLLEGNIFIQPLRPQPKDIVLSDIQSIPRVCQAIQKDWQNEGEGISFNRLTALALSRSFIRRMEDIASGRLQRQVGSVDILLTGCEVSLWLAEQLASDLKKAFPKLNIMAISSNKVLGLFGQEQSIPAIGFPLSRGTHSLTDAIVLIVSHSGGTFGPLQCSSLLQSVTRNIFAATSEWDCQVGKQLRSMYDEHETLADSSRLFTTGVGLAPAEPCSLSVAAMQQLLTNIFEHLCIVGTSNPRYRHITGAAITERDLQILERCNRDNIKALESIVGVDAKGNTLAVKDQAAVKELRAIGDRWAEHVLENAKAYIMSFVYIVATVTTGYPLFSGIGHAAGATEWAMYILRFLDSLFYFWLPQINITLLRIVQRRNLLHRMVARTVVIGDCPWVAQSAEAFLSKLFACSYSIAGLNVHSANPADHLVHRHTHRVVRGTLLVCGRPDGRLMALTSLESAVLLSVNQASSIQSWGGRCESVTIGHNPYDNALSYKSIFLDRHRPLFLCERVLDMTASPSPAIPPEHMSPLARLASATAGKGNLQVVAAAKGMSSAALLSKYSTLQSESRQAAAGRKKTAANKQASIRLDFQNRLLATAMERDDLLNISRSRHSLHNDLSYHGVDRSRRGRADSSRHRRRKSQGSITLNNRVDTSWHRGQDLQENMTARQEQDALNALPHHDTEMDVKDVLAELRLEQTEIGVAQVVFEQFDANNDGYLDKEKFIAAYKFIDPSISKSEADNLFEEANLDDSGELSFSEFLRLLTTPQIRLQAAKNRTIRDSVGLVCVKPSEGKYFDDDIYQKDIVGVSKIALAKSESLSMELYEARIASLQRFVSLTVMFHQLGHRVQTFFVNISFGLWGYRMDRTHSIMRVATTASPASGAHVRKQMEVLRVFNVLNRAVHTIAVAWRRHKSNKIQRLLTLQESMPSSTTASSTNSLTQLAEEGTTE